VRVGFLGILVRPGLVCGSVGSGFCSVWGLLRGGGGAVLGLVGVNVRWEYLRYVSHWGGGFIKERKTLPLSLEKVVHMGSGEWFFGF